MSKKKIKDKLTKNGKDQKHSITKTNLNSTNFKRTTKNRQNCYENVRVQIRPFYVDENFHFNCTLISNSMICTLDKNLQLVKQSKISNQRTKI